MKASFRTAFDVRRMVGLLVQGVRKNLVLLKRRRIHRNFRIPGCKYLDAHAVYLSGENHRGFRSEFGRFKALVRSAVREGSGVSFYKFGDGDYFFLKGEAVGSAAPGKRALSRPLRPSELAEFQKSASECSYYMVELDPENQARFSQTFATVADFPAEFAYAAVASRFLFREFDGQIGLIGASEKLTLIQELMKYKRYRRYLGVSKDFEYVRIPQRFACDDLRSRRAELEVQIKNSSAKIFLVGIGHLKSGVLAGLPLFRPAVYLDVGSGIDALAGVVDIARPYFGAWRNYRVPRPDLYGVIDLLQSKDKNIVNLK